MHMQRCRSALRRPAGLLSRAAAQAAPPALFFGIGANKIQCGGRITPFVFNHCPFAVHSLVITMLIYVITGGEFLRCTCSCHIIWKQGSIFASVSFFLHKTLHRWMCNTFRYHIEAWTMAECISGPNSRWLLDICETEIQRKIMV